MKDLFTVASFTIKDMIKRKSFIISNLIILAIIVLLFNVPNILNAIMGDNTSSQNTKILIVDEDNIFEGTLEQINQMDIGYEATIATETITFDEIKQKIDNNEIDDALVITKKDGQINMQYIVENLAMVSQMPQSLTNAISTIYSNLSISKLGLTPEQIQTLSGNFNFEMIQTEEEEVQGNQFAMMMMSLVLFYAIYFCAYQVSSSITTEKTSKIIETLVTSTKPKTIVLGKTIGIGVVGLIQIAAIIITALISSALFLEEGALDNVNVIYGLHVRPEINVGQISFTYGAMYASSNMFEVHVHGKSAHGAKSYYGIDSIIVASHIITQLHSFVSAFTDGSMRLHIGTINGGTANNIVADNVKMEGIIRMLCDDETREFRLNMIKNIIINTAKNFGAECEFIDIPSYPALINNDNAVNIIIESGNMFLGKENCIKENANMTTEDFSYYLQRVKGSFFSLGVSNDRIKAPIHNALFDIDEDAINIGVKMQVLNVYNTYKNKELFL